MKEYAYVFDYSTASIYEIEIDDSTDKGDTELLLSNYGLDIDDCYVMFTTEKKEIERLN